MKTKISMQMPDGTTWEVSVSEVAQNRAEQHKFNFGDDLKRSLDEDTIPLFECAPYEISKWAERNMRWSDLKSATKIAEAPKLSASDFQDAWRRSIKTLLLLFCTLSLASKCLAQPAILTKSYDTSRSGATTTETILTPDAVRARGMVKLPSIPVIGDARGMEAEPLVWNGVMVLPSLANVIRGVNPQDGAAIWQTAQLCVPLTSTPANDMWRVNDHFGMLSTGVIDPDTGKLYQVATCSSDGSGSQASVTQRMFVLDVRTGAVLNSVLVDGASNGLRYADSARKQRAALLLWRSGPYKFVVMLAGSFAETGANATGWLMAFDTYDNRFKAALSTRAGGWMSGQGPSEDMANGLIYLGLGNGAFNGTTTFGEAAMQVRFTPPSATTAAAFDVLHAWAPFSDAARTCANQQLTQPVDPVAVVTGTSAPSVVGAVMPMNTACSNAWGDQDANLFCKLLPDVHRLMCGGKDGVVWLVDTRNFPSTQPADFANPKANCAKVSMYQPGWNLGMDSCPTRLADLNRFPGGKTRHIHMTPATYLSPAGVHYELFFAENSPLQAWRVNPDGTMQYVARGNEMASPNSTGGTGGMPGGFCSVSSNAGASAMAWCSVPDGDANRTVTTGHVYGYDLSGLDTIVAGARIPTVWTSDVFTYNKFFQPVVWNGQLYVANYAGSLDVYALGASR